VFFGYGAHNISGAIGYGEYVDYQYGGKNIGSYLCSGSNGTGKVTYNGALSGPNGRNGVDVHTLVDFTPVYSAKLVTNWSPNRTSC
jgi:hypothetical protein